MHACIVYMQSNLLRQLIMQLHSLASQVLLSPIINISDRKNMALHCEDCNSVSCPCIFIFFYSCIMGTHTHSYFYIVMYFSFKNKKMNSWILLTLQLTALLTNIQDKHALKSPASLFNEELKLFIYIFIVCMKASMIVIYFVRINNILIIYCVTIAVCMSARHNVNCKCHV